MTAYADTIRQLRRLSVQEADSALCRMSTATLHALAAELGVSLPLVGGDKPSRLIAALFPPVTRGGTHDPR